jgi:hypothetical protein
MRLTELGRELDAFIRPGRGHTDVRHHHVGLELRHGPPERLQILALVHELDVGLVFEDPRDALARQIAVVRDQHADGHGRFPRHRLSDDRFGA